MVNETKLKARHPGHSQFCLDKEKVMDNQSAHINEYENFTFILDNLIVDMNNSSNIIERNVDSIYKIFVSSIKKKLRNQIYTF